jgi:hypothetical protein
VRHEFNFYKLYGERKEDFYLKVCYVASHDNHRLIMNNELEGLHEMSVNVIYSVTTSKSTVSD